MANDDIAALDAALAKSLDRDVLAVFADRLQAVDDPRGELIAIDLEIERSGARAELVARRTSVLEAWLGPELATIGDSVRFGFIEDLVLAEDSAIPLERISSFVATPIGRCIRGIAIIGDVEQLERALHAWSASDHPHLTRLELSATGGDIPIEQISDGKRTLEVCWARCPQLQTLTLRGDHVLESCTHPNVRRLVLTGFRALEQGAPMTSVEEIDFAFNDARSRDHGEKLEMQAADAPWILPIFSAEHLPALRRLDVSRNERELLFSRWDYGYEERTGEIPLFSWLAGQRILPQLTHLRVPSVRDADDHQHLVRVLEQAQRLEELVVARADLDYRVPPLAHPNARIEVPPFTPRRWVNGRFEVTQWIGPDEVMGIAIARDTLRDQLVRLTFADDVSRSADELRAILTREVAGLASVVYLGPAEREDGSMMLAEVLPPGDSLDLVAPETDPDRIAAFGAKLAAHVAHVHRAGTVLGSIRPENTFVTADGDIALIARGERLWMTCQFTRVAPGVPWRGGFRAPEIQMVPLLSDPAPSADVFSIGVLLAERLLGRMPYRWPDEFAIYLDQSQGRHLPLPETALGEILAQCLRAEPAARPSIDELAERLRS
jgi:hypothetical protein